ncbi:hypothetical protein [Streptantibioticus ferralitis]|uniref:Uncharacterized protein n=1 Tax=Streptantibioticus ferralitis TaxID=236510 RepID=A0ABT5Z7F9_9ACTN|nr:hypothetical protein [Streptantibioticus ferralitis]MDF2259760.1 hypothetical protein [Streptantibioticus ferralitis]
MLRIRPGARVYEPDNHPFLPRQLRGHDATMLPQQVYDAARGWWVLAEHALAQRFAVVVSRDTGLVVMAIAIEEWATDERGRRAFSGTILGPGDPVYDQWVGQPDPTPSATRSAVTYVDDPGTCRCGCGEGTRGTWRPGHDQRAVLQLIRHDFDGSVADFLDWYEAHGPRRAER